MRAVKRWLAGIACLAQASAVLTLPGCSQEDRRTLAARDAGAGTLGLELSISPGVQANSVRYLITGPNGFQVSDTVDVSKSQDFAALIGGIPAGSGYTITLSAASADGQTTCSGQAAFTVVAGQTNTVQVPIQCRGPVRDGNVVVNATFAFCPEIVDFRVSSLSIVVGGTLRLQSSAVDPDPGPAPLSYAWSATTGTFSDTTAANTSYKCTSAGSPIITLAVSDGNPVSPGCPASQSGTVTCVSCGADGVACNDGNECTLNDACKTDACTGAFAPVRTTCQATRLCNGAGSCVDCVDGTDCPGSDTACAFRTCTAGKCGVAFTAAGSRNPAQTAGDCHANQCDGAGNVVTVVDDTDLPVDGRACTQDSCSNGVASNPPLPAETRCETTRVCDGAGSCVDCLVAADCPGADSTCSTRTCNANICGVQRPPEGKSCNENGGQICDGVGSCVPVTFKVARIGTGGTTLNNTSAPVFIEQRALDGSLVGTPLALPTATSGSNRAFSLTGLAVSEGDLARSADGRYLTLAGYGVAPGSANVGISLAADVPRVVARIDAAGIIDTSTSLGSAFSSGSPRSATSVDGSAFWVSGSGAAASDPQPGGVWYAPLGGAGGNQLLSSGVRWVRVFGGQLFSSGNDAALLAEILDVGNGLPISGPQVATELPGMPTGTGPSPWAFVFFDRTSSISGLDTLYIADDRTGAGSGIQKWTFNGAVWSLVATMNLSPATRFRGLGGLITGSTVTLMATTVETSSVTRNRLVVFTDDGSASPVGTVVLSTPNNELLRGVAPTPR